MTSHSVTGAVERVLARVSVAGGWVACVVACIVHQPFFWGEVEERSTHGPSCLLFLFPCDHDIQNPYPLQDFLIRIQDAVMRSNACGSL